MRRVLAIAAVTTAVLAASACSGGDALLASPAVTTTPSLPTSPTATPRPTPSVSVTPGDPATTNEACTSATAGAADATKIFTEQLAAIEAAAAKGDQTAMVAAAGVIQTNLVALSTTLAGLSEKPVDTDVKAALTRAAAGLREISSESYAGTTQETQRRLGELAGAVALACS
jgi:hypothetical protein